MQRCDGALPNYAQEISTTQTALARLVHDLRQATSFSVLTPNAIEFQMVVNGTSYNVKYDCTAPDSLGSAYQRCARTSAPTSAQLPSYGATAGALDIQHVANGNVSTYCNQTGTAQSGSVFFISNPTIVNSDASGLLCDEAYENIIGAQFFEPTYVQVLAKIPSSGELTKGGLSHQTVLQSGAFIPNLDPGA